MNQVTSRQSGKIQPSEAPRLKREEAARQTGGEAALLVRSIRDFFGTGSVIPSLPDGEELLARCEAIASQLPDLIASLDELGRKATNAELTDGIDLLVESRAGQVKDKQIYGRLLIEDVAAQQPTMGGLIAMCRRVRRTCKYRPEIAEVLEILADEEYRLKFEREAAREVLSKECARLATAVAEEKLHRGRRSA